MLVSDHEKSHSYLKPLPTNDDGNRHVQSLTMTDVFRDRSHVFSVSGYVVLQSGLLSASDCFSRLFLADAAAEVLELVEDGVAAESARSARKRRARYSHQHRTV